MADDKPHFEHPQTQSNSPGVFAVSNNTDLDEKINALEISLLEKLRTQIHDGTQAPRINASDILGSLGATVYAGCVNSDGTANHLPNNWSSSKRGTGQYTVTHNLALGANLYTFLAIASGTVAFPKMNSVNTNDAQPDFLSDAGALTDTKFWFILTPLT